MGVAVQRLQQTVRRRTNISLDCLQKRTYSFL